MSYLNKFGDKIGSYLNENTDAIIIIAYTLSLIAWSLILTLAKSHGQIGILWTVFGLLELIGVIYCSIRYFRYWSDKVDYENEMSLPWEVVFVLILPAVLIIGLSWKVFRGEADE